LKAGLNGERLEQKGKRQLEWAEAHMPVLMLIRRELEPERPLAGLRIGAVLHVTKETGVLVRTLKSLGASVTLAGSNPLSTQDEIVAALSQEGIHVFARHAETQEEYYSGLDAVIQSSPQIVMDDGADLHALIHAKKSEISVIGGTEETTTGVNRLRAMEREGVLRYPVIAVNDAHTKHLFDNRYGTGQSTVDGILRATNLLLAGKTCVVAGYGWVGRGIAARLRGMGAKVIVTETNPVKALEAAMEGFDVRRMEEAAASGDIFVTATGNRGIIREEHFALMKDGAVLANSGHFDVEVDVKTLRGVSKGSRVIRENLEEFTLMDGRRLYLIAEGRLANLGAAEGHPSEVMDMSFSNQALSVVHLKRFKMSPKVHSVPPEIDLRIASLKLEAMGIKIDSMTESQEEYTGSWEFGT
jgi:adenosylhomocysteinase